MAITPEGKVKNAVKKVLASFGDDCWYHMAVQTGYGKPTLDFVICFHGKFFAIETKTVGKQLTAMQTNTARDISAAGGTVLRVTEENVHLLESWMLLMAGRLAS